MKKSMRAAAAVSVLALLFAVVAVWSASKADAAPAQRAGCAVVGHWNYGWHHDAPGSAWIQWTSNSTPTDCESLRVRIESDNNLYYESKWIHNVSDGGSPVSTAKCSCDKSALQRAWEEKELTGSGGTCQQRLFYPTKASRWSTVNCKNQGFAPAHTTAVHHCNINPLLCGHYAMRTCSVECLATQWNFAGSPAWSQTEWTINQHIWYERGRTKCQEGRTFIQPVGGWVTSIDLYSRATCPTGYNGILAGWDEKTCKSCSFTTHWVSGSLAATALRRDHLGLAA